MKRKVRLFCATDVGREGEAIFRYIYDSFHISKPVKRLWISSLTDQAIKEGIWQSANQGKIMPTCILRQKARKNPLVNRNRRDESPFHHWEGESKCRESSNPTLGMIVKSLTRIRTLPSSLFLWSSVSWRMRMEKVFWQSFSDRYERKRGCGEFYQRNTWNCPSRDRE